MNLRFPHCASIALLVAATLVAAQTTNPPAPASPPKGSKAKAAEVQASDPGEIVSGLYSNRSFGFTFKLPFGWVDRTDFMRQDSADAKADPSKSMVLLATFERPPEASGDTVNSAVIIAAESVSSYPGLKDASQYFGPVAEIAKSQGFTAVSEPYDFPVGGRPIVRQDFSKKLAGLTMVQSSLAMLHGSYIVSFTFIADSLDDTTQTLDHLRFGRPPEHTDPAKRR